MSENGLISDEEVRLQALDAETSFLIQAPAGSGKTELLTQRLLRLLSVVSRPEEILAITFTQKAAAEMRERVELSLGLASKQDSELADYLQVTRKLAVAALANAEAQGWPLLQSLDRLRIMTLDAFNRSLINAAPVSSTLGGAPEPVSEHAASLVYQQTASEMLSWIRRKDALGEQAATLLSHVDDETTSWRRSFETLLQSREQWLPLVGVIDKADGAQLRKTLESTLENLVSGPLRRFDQMLDVSVKADLARLLSGAAERLRDSEKYKNHLEPFLVDAAFPQPDADELPKWQAIAGALTISTGKKLRSSVNVRDGFGPDYKDEKAAMMALLEEFESNSKYLARLAEIRDLPCPRFEDEHWEVLMALLQLLPNAVAQLSSQFERRGVADYSELARAARAVLGTPEAPTDLALSLDYRIRHILVDEMQDTSISQYALLEALTLGWQPDDGRTLFCVGDPMQSIYRFRQAEVSRFLLAGEQGIGALPLVPLRLTRNFRSAPALVDWCNQSFGEIFPEVADIALAAVRHSPSLPAVKQQPNSGVEIHPVIGADHELEAERVLELIKAEIAAGSKDIAVLVRARSHLSALIPALQAEGIAFDSVEIDPLHLRSEVRLLTAITLALMHAGDRLNWLAILRSPWIGLSLT
ncbi:MAG: UvrD-helicase domain-containing protein, partial [Pseudomonadota bacterium]